MTEDPGKNTLKRLWMGLAVLVVLSPLGLILPAWLGSGKAWGEWSQEEIGRLTGRVPEGIRGASGLWHSLLPDYTIPGLGANLGYVLSAALGLGVVVGLTLLVGRLLAKKERGEK